MVRAVVIAMSVTKSIYDFVTFLLARSMWKKPLPENVRDVYSREEYEKYIRYKKDCARSDTARMALSFVLDLVFLVFNVYSLVFNAFASLNIYPRYILMILIFAVIEQITGIPFAYYDTFVIEEKYGINPPTGQAPGYAVA